jgi:hypothetical protein
MSIADELNKLEDLRRRGVLTDAEFERAKAAVLAGGAAPARESPVVEHLTEQLAEVRYQNELARIDREWEIEREQYMMTDKYGNRQVPTPGMSLVMAVVIGIFGIGWTIMAFSITSSGPQEGGFEVFSCLFPLFGIVFTCVGIGVGINAYAKAQKYQEALAAYQRRRAQVRPGQFDAQPERDPGPRDDRITT